MKRDMFSLSFGLCVFFLAARALHAQEVSCADHETIVQHLGQHFGEARQMAGLSAGGQLVEVFGAENTGTWTIVITEPSGTSCLLVTGEYFERYEGVLNPARQGEPM